MALKELKYLKIDDVKGILYSAGQRSLIIPATFVKGIFQGLSDIISPSGAQFLVYKIGHDLGKQYVKTLQSILKGEKVKVNKKLLLTETYNAISTSAGWGRIKFNILDLRKGEIEIEIKNTPSCQYVQQSCCSIERGILAGAYEEIFGKEVYFDVIRKRSRRGRVILKALKEAPPDIEKKEKLLLIERKELEKKVEERTALLKKKTKELERSRGDLSNILVEVEEARSAAEKERKNVLSIITNFTDGVLVFNKKQELILINPQAEDMLEVDGGDLINKYFASIGSLPKIKPLFDVLGKEINEVIRKEIVIKDDLITEVSSIKLTGHKREATDMVIIHDVSREKLMERIKSEFITIAAHQFRTPLSAVKWSLKMLVDGDLGDMTPEQKTMIMQTYRSNERMIRLVDDFLNVARIEEGKFGYKFAPMQLEFFIDSVIHDFDHAIREKKIDFVFNKPQKEFPKVNIDHSKLRLALQNLLDNAIKYTSHNGKIIVSIKKSRQNLRTVIKDTGMGIPKDEQKRLFGKFFRSVVAMKRETEGSGLGLFIAKNIIEKHGGKIGVKSEGKDKGSEFWFELPIV